MMTMLVLEIGALRHASRHEARQNEWDTSYNARPVSSLETAPAVIIYGTAHSSRVVNLALGMIPIYSSYYGKTHIITDHERVIACFQKPANKLEASKSRGKRGKGNEPDKANPSTRENNPNKHTHAFSMRQQNLSVLISTTEKYGNVSEHLTSFYLSASI
ncbi:hypothetical protein EAF00_004057 [Botryotinia globosa]|nr:hypothetical protein EAF00_004057 [Botryotinia globosa]